MASTISSFDSTPAGDDALVKVLICGGFGTGKTTLIGAVSEIKPVSTEEQMTTASVGVDELDGLAGKTTTTVLMDFGRRRLDESLVLYLFGASGQQRFKGLWQDTARGAIGALVLVDARRINASFAALDLAEDSALPYVVAVNEFPDAPALSEETVREHLDLDAATPVLRMEAPDPAASLLALRTLVRHVITLRGAVPA